MTMAGKTLTTGEYSELSGIAVPTVTKMLRTGKLKGQKINGKWAIDAGELQNGAAGLEQPRKTAQNKTSSIVHQQPSPKAPGGNKAYDLETFARMTYLTEKGVRQWVKTGRLTGHVDADGNLQVDAGNLHRPEIRHLIRK